MTARLALHLAALVGVVAAVPAPGSAQYVDGVVLEWGSERPIDGATVSLVRHEGGLSVTEETGRDGRFYVRVPGLGAYTLVIRALGYDESAAGPVRVAAGMTTQVRYFLTAEPVEIEPLEVVVERRATVLDRVGFYERQIDGSGSFLTRDDVLDRRPDEMADLLRRVPGVRVDRDRQGRPVVLLRASRSRRCYPHVFLDGVREVGGGAQPVYISQFVRPDDIAGIEVYAGSGGVPIQFSGGRASCGVIVVWTR